MIVMTFVIAVVVRQGIEPCELKRQCYRLPRLHSGIAHQCVVSKRRLPREVPFLLGWFGVGSFFTFISPASERLRS